jgi:hypothetical protein
MEKQANTETVILGVCAVVIVGLIFFAIHISDVLTSIER